MARAGADRGRSAGTGGPGESNPQTDRVRGPADVQSGPEPDPRESSRLDRYARPLHGRGHGDGARGRPPLVRAPDGAPRHREGDGHACGEALPGADHIRLLRWLTGGGEPSAWLGGSDPGYPAGRRADRRRFAARPGRERRGARHQPGGPERLHYQAQPAASPPGRLDGHGRAPLGRLEGRDMKRLVLDLRDNGGGSVDEAARVAGEFLPKGAIVYTEQTRKKVEGEKDTVRVSRSFWSHEKRYPLVVLINAGTASASELVAGALQDHDRAVIVGRPSFGKALLMRGLPLADGSMIMLVVGHVTTPCGRVVQRQYRGITRRDYFRLARAERDTAGRPSCKTDGGRTVYGGGGIYPDVVLPEPDPPPLWLARAREDNLPLKWVGGYVAAAGASLPALDSLAAHPLLPAAAQETFRTFAAAQGVAIPADAGDQLQRLLVRSVALAKWGEEGLYRIAAASDPAVETAARQFDRATAILNVARPN